MTTDTNTIEQIPATVAPAATLLPAIYIDASPIRAALHCAAGTKDPRSYLRGVFVRIKNGANGIRATVAGCDGHLIFVGACEVTAPDPDDVQQWLGVDLIIPPDVVKKIDKHVKQIGLVQISDGVYSIANIVFKPVEGQYPDIRRVIPDRDTITKYEVKPAVYNPDLLVRARKALLEYYSHKSTTVYMLNQYGDDGGIMHAGENIAQVVIMPVRMNGVSGTESVQPFTRDYL